MAALVVAMLLASCRLGVAPGLTHRLDRGTTREESAVVGGVQGELGAVLPYRTPYIGGAGVFVVAGTMAEPGPDSHKKWIWLLGDLRYRRIWRETPGRRRYWSAGLGGGVENDDGVFSTHAELGAEIVVGRTSFDISGRHRFMVIHEPGTSFYNYLNLFQLGLAFGVAH